MKRIRIGKDIEIKWTIKLPEGSNPLSELNLTLQMRDPKGNKVGATTWTASYAVSWVSGVSSTGTFVKPTSTSIATGNNGVPSGWTVENY